MSRAALIALAAIAARWPFPGLLELAAQGVTPEGGKRNVSIIERAFGAIEVASLNPHVDPGVVVAGCNSCHRGHGQSRSPMLGAAQKEVCLSCHGTAGQVDRLVAREVLAAGARPTLMSRVFDQPFRHRLDDRVFSRREPGVTCTSCHSPHRSAPGPGSGSGPSGVRKLSPRNPNRFEYQLCADCHGGRGPALVDVGGLFEPHNRSYHPLQIASVERSPSIVPALAGREISCTDCHGNSDPSGPRGPHGSDVRHLLRWRYATVDGSAGSDDAYALCYSCHRSEQVLADESRFPFHRLHVVDQRTACATCHDPHGSVQNRALIRYQATGTVAPSASGVLLFRSTSPGDGTCYLTCHGRNHDPEVYGLAFGLGTLD